MALSIPDRVVVFDYGEVVSQSPSEHDRAALLAIADVPVEAFWNAYQLHRDDLDHGVVGIRDYWKRVAGELGLDWSEARIQQLWVADYRSWLSIEPTTFDIIADLNAGGTRIAMLSNAGFDFASPLRFAPIARFFERVFISAELGMLKPDPEIYQEVADELGIALEQMIFIDNKQENVDGANALGIRTHLFLGAGQLREFLDAVATQEKP